MTVNSANRIADPAAADLPLNPPLHRLFTRLLAEQGAPEGADWDPREGSVDASVYRDPAFHQRELDAIFRRMPLCLGHADQLREPGSLIARELFGLPLLIVRDRQGEINVLLNVCRHRGARLVAEQESVCRKASLSCPYHAWNYDLDGRLRGVPGAEGFPTLDKDGHGLRRLPAQVRHGLIWAIMDPQGSDIDVAGFLGGIDDDLTVLGLGSHRFFSQHSRRGAANWKLMMDAFQEVYHIRRLHSSTISPFFPDPRATGEGEGLHTRILVARDRLPEAAALPPAQWDVRQHATLTHAIFPNSLLIYHPDATSHMAMFPIGPDQMQFVHTLFTPHEPRNDKEHAHWARTFKLIDEGVFGSEDLFISEQIQLGLASGANARFTLGRFEQHLRRFHENVRAVIDRAEGAAA